MYSMGNPHNSGEIGVGLMFSTENLQYLSNGQDKIEVIIDDQ